MKSEILSIKYKLILRNTCKQKSIPMVWCKTIVPTLFYIASYNNFSTKPSKQS